MKIVALLLSGIILVNCSPVTNDETIPHILLELLPDDFGPVDHNLNATESDVDFYFRCRNLDENGVIVNRTNPTSITSAGFDVAKQTVFIIHGWQNDHSSHVNLLVGTAFLEAQDINIIVVEWEKIAKLGYVYAQSNVQFVGTIVGNFINQLMSEMGISGEQIGLVGHSLGAHVAGIAGSTTGGSLRWIVGLDPAGPLFSLNNLENRLDSSDAQFVQVIHTCAGLLGFNVSIGDADYWPNGGVHQPGCDLDVIGVCRHSRSYYYYSESIVSGNFISIRCDNYEDYIAGTCQDDDYSWMGEDNIDQRASQNYYLETNANAPFAKG